MLDARAELEKVILDKSVDHRLRSKAVRSLGRIEDPRSEEVLLKALEDEYPVVRHEAISALARVGGEEARAALERLLDCKSLHLRSMVAVALIKISGIPEAKSENLELLFKLLSSRDNHIEDAILQMGNPGLVFLSGKLDEIFPPDHQHAARVLALRIRRKLNQISPGQEPFSWLARHDIPLQAISDLYRFSINRKDRLVDLVTNTGFDRVSRTLCGDKKICFAQNFALMEYKDANIWSMNLNELLEQYGAGQMQRMGRTLIAPMERGFLALKLCVNYGDEKRLFIEAQLQKYLGGMALSSTLPRPLGRILRIKGLPDNLRKDLLTKETLAIGYTASPSYFTYINNPQLSLQELEMGLCTCARDLARLTRKGLIHTSLIPLFHKKRNGLQDDTAYCWQRKTAGRLERWLESCRYPNLRLSGIADFEHIEIHGEILPENLQPHIGGHLLSMSLVLASYFKHKCRFDQKALKSILKNCCYEYYCALTERRFGLDEVIDWDVLASRMVEEMGSDRYNRDDEVNLGGPHLGIPRGPFPIPELIRAIHLISVFSIIQMQSGLHASLSCDESRDCIPPPLRSHNIS